MKKQLALALGLGVISTSAFATKARLIALGEDQNGSQYISDNRNIFLNAAQVNKHKDFVTLEWGSSGSAAGATGSQDSDTEQKAEGGFVKSSGNFIYGLHVGSEYNTGANLRNLVNDDADFQQDNKIDLWIGGDAGFKWGANLAYSKTEDETVTNKTEQDSLTIRLGALMNNTDVFANINLANNAEVANSGSNFDGKLGFELGASHMWNNYTWFVYGRKSDFDYTNAEATTLLGNGTATSGKFESMTLRFGAGRAHSLNDKAKLFTKLFYETATQEASPNTGSKVEINSWKIPVVVGVEVMAKEWLALRGSVEHAIQSEEEYKSLAAGQLTALGVGQNGKRSIANSTNVNVGASLIFGDLTVDGLVGTGNDSTGAIVGSGAEDGILSADRLMSRVSMTYKF